MVQAAGTGLACGAITLAAPEGWWPRWVGSVLVLVVIGAGAAIYEWVTAPTRRG